MEANQLAEWIRQNIFGELSEEAFASTALDKAKETYTKIKVYFEEHALKITSESLTALKDKFMSDMAPTADEIAQFGEQQSSDKPAGTAPAQTEAVTLTHVNERLKSLEKKAMWIVIALIIIILIK